MSRDLHGAMEITSFFFTNCPVAYNNVVVQTLHVTRELMCKHPVSLLILFVSFFFFFILAQWCKISKKWMILERKSNRDVQYTCTVLTLR